jgi:hypothetical protein
MAQMVYIQRIAPSAFLHFSTTEESFRLRDYSAGPSSPPVEVMRQDLARGITASAIRREAQQPGNRLLAAPNEDLKNSAFWHNHIVGLNARYLVSTPPPPTVGPPNVPAGEEPAERVPPAVEPAPWGAVAEILDLLSAEKYCPDEDPWLPQAKSLVEKSIDRLVEEFLEYPYLHRVEHSIHAQLFCIMVSHQELAQRVPLGENLGVTQLVHKEWPETVAREGNRRGNFDLAILSPKLLHGCPSIEAFRGGRLHAPIVIEMGLDYDAEHLAGDAKKLINSKPKHAYLLHLVRDIPREEAAEQIIVGIEAKFGIKTAYAWKAGSECAFKRVNDKAITEQ